MKTYDFNICKYHITITIEKKNYEVINPKIVSEQYTSTVNEPTPEIKMKKEVPDLCFLEAAERYIGAQRWTLAPSTIKNYKNIIEKHLSSIWLIRLDRLMEDHLQEAFDAEIAKGLSVKTLKGYRSLVLKILSQYRPDFHPNIRVIKEDADETT